MSRTTPPRRRVQLSELLTIDDLINLVASKAHTRRGRVVVGGMSAALLLAIIFVPIAVRSNHGAGPSSTPVVPVVTEPPSSNGETVGAVSPLVFADTGDKQRYGQPLTQTTPATVRTPPPTTPPPTTPPPTAAPIIITSPPATAAPPPPVYVPPPTNPPPTNPPVTNPPLTAPPDGPIQVGG